MVSHYGTGAEGADPAQGHRTGPGSRAGPGHPSWIALIEAGLDLLGGRALSDLSVADVSARADLAKGTFYVHFSDRSDYLRALHRHFHHSLAAQVMLRVGPLDPGGARVVAGIIEFLESCLRQPAARALLSEARFDSALAAQHAEYVTHTAAALAREMRRVADGPLLGETAYLLVATAVELSALEMASAHRMPRHRAALLALVRPRP